MSKIQNFQTHLLQMLFQNIVSGTHIANIGSGLLASITPGSLWISLHTADPGETPATEQSASEATYTNYSPNGRQAVARSAGGWAVAAGPPTTADNVADIDFPVGGATGNTILFFGVGTVALPSGNGQLLYRGTVTPNLVVSSGVPPTFSIGDCNIAED